MTDQRPETYKHIQTVQGIMLRAVTNILFRSERHDRSKLESPEREAFDEYTPKLAGSTYGSEEYKGFLQGLKPALDHHYAANSHHPEHYRWRCAVCERRWTDAQWQTAPEGPGDSGLRFCPDCSRHGIIYETYLESETDKGLHGMSLLDLVEMLCDWKAATMRHDDGDLAKSIEINQKRFGYSEEVRMILVNTANEMGLFHK